MPKLKGIPCPLGVTPHRQGRRSAPKTSPKAPPHATDPTLSQGRGEKNLFTKGWTKRHL